MKTYMQTSVRMIMTLVAWMVGFEIQAASVFTMPNTNTVWYPGDKVFIGWDTNVFSPNDRVCVEVRSDSSNNWGGPVGYHEYIHYFEANTGIKEWVVPDIKSETTTFELVIYNNTPYGLKHSSGFFQIRFGHSRPKGATTLKVQQSVCLSWTAVYGNLYEVQSSSDLKTWISEGYIVADREDFGATVLASSENRSYRTVDWGPYSE